MTENTKLPATLQIQNDRLYLNNEFQNTLDRISKAVNHAQSLVSVQTVSKLDPESLEITISDLGEAQKLARDVNKTRRDLKRYLKGKSDAIVAQFDEALNKAQFDKLSYFDAKAKTLKKELSQYRVNKHWEEIKPVFEANLDDYSLIKKLAPSLTSFDTFRIRHPKLVTGAKSWRLGDKQMAAVNQDLYDINECLTDLNANPMHLGDSYRTAVLNGFIQNPTKENYYQLKDKMLAQMQTDLHNAQLAKEQAEKQKQAEEQAKLAQQRAAELQQKAAQSVDSTEKANYQAQASAAYQQAQQYQNQQLQASKEREAIMKQKELERNQSRKWLADYVMVNAAKYNNIANDVRQKARLVYDLMHDLDNTASQFYEYVHQEDDTTKQAERVMAVMKEIALV